MVKTKVMDCNEITVEILEQENWEQIIRLDKLAEEAKTNPEAQELLERTYNWCAIVIDDANYELEKEIVGYEKKTISAKIMSSVLDTIYASK